MSKTIAVSDNTHVLIVEKQMEIYKKYRVNVRIFDIADIILKNFIDKTEELLGLRSKESKENERTIEDIEIKKPAEMESSDVPAVDGIYTDQAKEVAE